MKFITEASVCADLTQRQAANRWLLRQLICGLLPLGSERRHFGL